jgi:salicylate hydroxylase
MSVMPGTILPTLRVAIVGGGPGGLSAAIALSKLPNVEVTIYEQARELREIGAGIQIGYNCWKVLELLDAADKVKGHVQEGIIHRCFKPLSVHL